MTEIARCLYCHKELEFDDRPTVGYQFECNGCGDIREVLDVYWSDDGNMWIRLGKAKLKEQEKK